MKLNIIATRKWWFALSALVLLPGLLSIFLQGFNLGIDFTGGTLLDLKFSRPVTVAEVRQGLTPHGLDNSIIQTAADESAQGAQKAVLIRTKVLSEEERRIVLNDLAQSVAPFEVLRVEKVGAVIGEELTKNAVYALLFASLGIIAYVSWRFEYRFAVAAIVALFHDIVLVLGIFSLLQKEIDSSFVAAILTILGYSINDTIVIFDRIRENLKTLKKGQSFEGMVNNSISQTLARSIYTVLTVVMATAALYWFGGETTKNFSLALLIGFVSGAYSSIFNASPIWVAWKEWEQGKRSASA